MRRFTKRERYFGSSTACVNSTLTLTPQLKPMVASGSSGRRQMEGRAREQKADAIKCDDASGHSINLSSFDESNAAHRNRREFAEIDCGGKLCKCAVHLAALALLFQSIH